MFFVKIIAMAIWSVLVLYFYNTLHLEKSIFNYVILFLILLVGASAIDWLGNRSKRDRKKS